MCSIYFINSKMKNEMIWFYYCRSVFNLLPEMIPYFKTFLPISKSLTTDVSFRHDIYDK